MKRNTSGAGHPRRGAKNKAFGKPKPGTWGSVKDKWPVLSQVRAAMRKLGDISTQMDQVTPRQRVLYGAVLAVIADLAELDHGLSPGMDTCSCRRICKAFDLLDDIPF